MIALLAIVCVLPFGGHAHNDYRHPHPLQDALDQGFVSVEADVFLAGDRLLVGHDPEELKTERSLENLYLAPLFERVRKQRGRVYATTRDRRSFQLLVDVKTEAEVAWKRLEQELEPYRRWLTEYRGGRVVPRGVTVVVSGNRAIDAMRGAQRRWTFVDGRATDLDAMPPTSLVPLVSENWRGLFEWTGIGPVPASDEAKLRAFVARAHAQGRTVRFWAAPDLPASWDLQRRAGVDWINTDRLNDFAAHWAHLPGE